MQTLGKRGEGYVFIQFILFGLIFFAPNRIGFGEDWGATGSIAGMVIGLVLLLLGAGLAVAGVFFLGGNLTAVPHPKQNSSLVTSGAYALVRHPIYSGIILGAFGWGFLYSSLLTLALAAILFLFFDIKSRQEERWLSEKFDDYSAYQQRVKKLIPFLY